MSVHHSKGATGAVFGIESRYGDEVPGNGHHPPPQGVLTLTSNDGSGYKSAHRELAKSLGFRVKEIEYRHMSMSMVPTVHTYWTR